MCNLYPNLKQDLWTMTPYDRLVVARDIAAQHGLVYTTPLPKQDEPDRDILETLRGVLAWVSSPQNKKRFNILDCGWPHISDNPKFKHLVQACKDANNHV